MAAPALSASELPGERELRSFSRTVALLLTQRHTPVGGSRIVVRTAGVGVQHLDHREYTVGDDVRHVDWRQTARRRRPIIRRFESESVSDWTLLLDASSSMFTNDAVKWRAAVLAAAAIGYALLDVGHRVGLVAFGNGVIAECPRGRGHHHYAAVARVLRSIHFPERGERSDLGACASRVHGISSLFIFSDFLTEEETRHALRALLERASSLHALQLVHPSDACVDEVGDVDLVDVETGARATVHADGKATAAAMGERAAMTGRLRSFCARSGIAFSEWPVGQAWQQTLVAHFVHARSL